MKCTFFLHAKSELSVTYDSVCKVPEAKTECPVTRSDLRSSGSYFCCNSSSDVNWGVRERMVTDLHAKKFQVIWT